MLKINYQPVKPGPRHDFRDSRIVKRNPGAECDLIGTQFLLEPVTHVLLLVSSTELHLAGDPPLPAFGRCQHIKGTNDLDPFPLTQEISIAVWRCRRIRAPVFSLVNALYVYAVSTGMSVKLCKLRIRNL